LASSGRGRQAKQKVSGEALPSFCTWANYFLLTALPGIKDPSRKAEDKEMFQGTTIEELINSVVRAEDHAREQEKMQALALERQYPLRRFEWRQEMVEVA
jgi:hypothetical protein